MKPKGKGLQHYDIKIYLFFCACSSHLPLCFYFVMYFLRCIHDFALPIGLTIVCDRIIECGKGVQLTGYEKPDRATQ